MGTVQSLSEQRSSSWYNPNHSSGGGGGGGGKLLRRHQCPACGTSVNNEYSNTTESLDTNTPIHPQTHYPAVLCGIWLGRPDLEQLCEDSMADEQQQQQMPLPADYESSLPTTTTTTTTTARHYEARSNTTISDTIPSTQLPKRAVAVSKPGDITATLLKHTSFTRNERSALNQGFFSTMEMTLSSAAGTDWTSRLEGCHIHGCLFVEHGNLVFQSADTGTDRLPLLLTSPTGLHGRRTESVNLNQKDRSTGLLYTDQTATTTNTIPRRFPSLPSALCQKTRNKLLAYLHDNYWPNGSGKRHCSCPRRPRRRIRCGLSTNTGSKTFPTGPCRPEQDTCPVHRKRFSAYESLESPRTDGIHVNEPFRQLPPPPLRLCWSLCTLRRFGFYGNSLFKLEAGRRAPRGEGLYLFVVRGLKDFRLYIEKYVHRRRTSQQLSPSAYNRYSLHERTASQPLTLGPIPSIPLSVPEVPSRDSSLDRAIINTSVLSSTSATPLPIASDLHIVASQTPKVCTLKQKANSLSIHPLHQNRRVVTPDCLNNNNTGGLSWHCHPSNKPSGPTHVDAIINCHGVIQKSCPQLVTSSRMHLSNRASGPQTDELMMMNPLLPDPPPPPPSPLVSSSTQALLLDSTQPAPPPSVLYDNVGNWIHGCCSNDVTRQSPALSRSGHGVTGRVYTTRRAMTSNAVLPYSSVQVRDEDYEMPHPQSFSTLAGTSRLEIPLGHRNANVLETPCLGHTTARHTSLPNQPVTCVASVQGSCPLVASALPPGCHSNYPLEGLYCQQGEPGAGGDFSPSSKTLFRTASSPYYNLTSPEVLLHINRTRSLSRGETVKLTPDIPPIHSHTPCSLWRLCPATSGCNFKARSASLRGCTSHPNPPSSVPPHPPPPPPHRGQTNLLGRSVPSTPAGRSVDESAAAVCGGGGDLTRSGTTRSACSTESDRVMYTEGFTLPNRLHYATLDFGPSEPIDLNGDYEIPVESSESNSHHHPLPHAIHGLVSTNEPNSRPQPLPSSSTDSCPVHAAYGTLIAGDVLSEQTARFRSTNTLDQRGINPGAPGAVELPSNYVAICQLQTLAMRAVLDATT